MKTLSIVFFFHFPFFGSIFSFFVIMVGFFFSVRFVGGIGSAIQ